MRIQLIFLACVIFFYGCAKEAENHQDKQDKKVVEIWKISSASSSVYRSTVYKINTSEHEDTVSVVSIDTSFQSFDYLYFMQERKYVFDPGTKQLIKVTSRSINDGKYNNLPAAIYDNVFDYVRDGLNYSRFTISRYTSAGDAVTELFNTYLLGTDPTVDGSVYITYPPGSANVPTTITLLSKDDRILGITEEDRPPSNRNHFTLNIPGYQYRNISRYYYHYDNGNRCTAVEVENGFYDWVGNERVFKPTARRRIGYQYSNDFSKFKEAVSNIQLFEKSPWLRIAQWRSTSYESYDLYDFYNTVSSAYTDSLFTINNSGQSSVVSGSTYIKEAEKDRQGNIVSITERNSKNSYTVKYLLKY
jgi:hypothetical protein